MPNVKRTLTYQGKTQTIPAWSRTLGIPESTIRSRLDDLGLSVEEALSRPVDRRFRPTPKRRRISLRPVPALQDDGRGRAIVRWSHLGTRYKRSFGTWGSAQAEKEYSRWAAEWYACQGTAAPPPEQGHVLSVAGLIALCLDWAAQHYRKHDQPTSEVAGFEAALSGLNDLYGDTAAADFGPTQLRALQASWVTKGLSLSTCNKYLHRAIRCFQFGAGRGLVPPSVPAALAHVEYLQRGRSAARPPQKITAAPDATIEAILPHLHTDPDRQAVLSALVRLQRATGMRPGEVLELRPEDLDRTQVPWLYCPASGGKAYHHDKDRRVWLGPRAREILTPWLETAKEGELVFRIRHRRAKRSIPVSLAYYRDRIAAACLAAGVEKIKPNQIRHTKGTEVQRAYEDDGATAAVLGNTPEVARQVYTDSPADAVARRIAEALG